MEIIAVFSLENTLLMENDNDPIINGYLLYVQIVLLFFTEFLIGLYNNY